MDLTLAPWKQCSYETINEKPLSHLNQECSGIRPMLLRTLIRSAIQCILWPLSLTSWSTWFIMGTATSLHTFFSAPTNISPSLIANSLGCLRGIDWTRFWLPVWNQQVLFTNFYQISFAPPLISTIQLLHRDRNTQGRLEVHSMPVHICELVSHQSQ